MSEVLSLPTSKYVPASELPRLERYVGKTFITRKNQTVRAVKLAEVKNSKVYLEYTEEREDKFSISLNKFLKYYELPRSSLIVESKQA